jgi:alpha-tubulin suppressor-like RCC1 family protein
LGVIGPGPLALQWQQGGTNLADGGKIRGSRTVSLVVSNAQAAEMANYSVMVSNAYGAVASSNAPLTLWPLVSWGHNDYGQANVPAGLSHVASIAAGHYHSLALQDNGAVAAWGAGTSYAGISPHFGQSAVPAALSNVTAVAAGYYHSLALQADGTVAAWGASSNSLGTSPNYGQTRVPGLLSQVTAVVGGAYHSLALKSDQTVTAWGAGTNNTCASPHYGQSRAPAGLSNVVALAAGAFHSLALKSDGTVLAWGAGTNNTGANPHYGQSDVPAGLSNVVALAAGAFHSLALKADGTVLGWGAGVVNTGASPHYGQSQVPADLSNVVAIAAGAYHSLAVMADGTMIGWGANSFGQTNVPSALSNVISVAVRGGFHVLALEGDGRPHFTVQPVSQALPAGPTLSFTAMAVGQQILGYQWQYNGTNLTDSELITGCHSRTLTLSNMLAGSYRAVVTNAYGSATSAVATLTGPRVVPPPLLQLPTWAQSNGLLSFAWIAVSGQTYQVQYKQDLTESNWFDLGSPLTATNDTAAAWDPATNAQRFYRVILVP